MKFWEFLKKFLKKNLKKSIGKKEFQDKLSKKLLVNFRRKNPEKKFIQVFLQNKFILEPLKETMHASLWRNPRKGSWRYSFGNFQRIPRRNSWRNPRELGALTKEFLFKLLKELLDDFLEKLLEVFPRDFLSEPLNAPLFFFFEGIFGWSSEEILEIFS